MFTIGRITSISNSVKLNLILGHVFFYRTSKKYILCRSLVDYQMMDSGKIELCLSHPAVEGRSNNLFNHLSYLV